MLRVDGVPPETKKQLQEAARQLYGKPNASLLVRSLIAGRTAAARNMRASRVFSPCVGTFVLRPQSEQCHSCES